MKQDRLQKYYSFHARIYDVTRRYILIRRDRAAAALEIQEGDRILDVACGTALNLPHLQKRTPALIVGVDLSRDMLRRARKKYARALLVSSDVSTAPFRKVFDKAICSYGLSIIDDWTAILPAVQKSLTPEGTFVVLDFYPLQGVLSVFNPLLKLWLKWHGVSAEKPIEKSLKTHFQDVRVEVPRFGYSAIWVASRPIP